MSDSGSLVFNDSGGLSSYTQWVSYMNSAYINLYAPLIKIFKLDKEATDIDELYGDEKAAGRIYLPPFEMRAYHLDNTWRQVLGEGTMPYLEVEDNIQFVMNFDDMVHKCRTLKYGHLVDMNIEYTGSARASIIKSGNTLTVIDGSTQYPFDLTLEAYNTTKKLSVAIHSLTNFSVEYYGEKALSTKIVSFAKTYFHSGTKVNVYVADETYQNITDVIEAGDLILTNKWRLYEVLQNVPGGDYGWDYSTWVLTCNIRSLDKAQLPNNYNEQIRRHEYGLRDKIDME